MRLHRLKIGSAASGDAQRFKNLKDVTIDFDQSHWVTIVIGWNGTGKSNVIEALTIIFRDLIRGVRRPEFAYTLSYEIGFGPDRRFIYIDADPDRKGSPILIRRRLGNHTNTQQEDFDGRDAENVRVADFLEGQDDLPHYVFGYYSGESTRLRDLFNPYIEWYDSRLRNGEDPGLKRLFFALPIHSQFVLLSFLIQPSPSVRKFLIEHLAIDPEEGLESVLFVMREPPWKSLEGDPRFWNARGVVQGFLSRLYDAAVAPIRTSRRVATSRWNENKLEFQYLYVQDLEALRGLVSDQRGAEFFRDLESTYVSELLEEVRVRVKITGEGGVVTFRELSEGEQQLLTVLGLLRFTAEAESLFLLDEPDTHLNPRWCVDYLTYLKNFIGAEEVGGERSHVVLTTHNPLAIADLEKEQVQILRIERLAQATRVVAHHPEYDPRGMGYGAIVTSDMFGISSALDRSTRVKLEVQRSLAARARLNEPQRQRLDELNAELDRLGFRFFHPDDEFSRYLKFRDDALRARLQTDDPEKLGEAVAQMNPQELDDLSRSLIEALTADDVR